MVYPHFFIDTSKDTCIDSNMTQQILKSAINPTMDVIAMAMNSWNPRIRLSFLVGNGIDEKVISIGINNFVIHEKSGSMTIYGMENKKKPVVIKYNPNTGEGEINQSAY